MSVTTLLQINASMHSHNGTSSHLAEEFVRRWTAANPDGHVIVRDLGSEPVPHLTAERFGAFVTPIASRDAAQQAVVDYSDGLIAEIKAADVLVIGLPMYNFGVPSTLKSYFDHIARAGETFRYTANGPVGLLGGKKVYVFATRGGTYVGTPLDTQTSYVRDFLAFIGLRDTQFVYAEGLAISAESKQAGLAAAHTQIEQLSSRALAA
jgi:FMN-dependent NADH-azoreductase